MPDWGFEERRHNVRFPVTIFTKYTNQDTHDENWAKTHDLSVKGLCLVTNEELSPGSTLHIWLKMPDNGEQIKLTAKSLWKRLVGSEKYRIGFKFDEKSEIKPIPIVLRTIPF